MDSLKGAIMRVFQLGILEYGSCITILDKINIHAVHIVVDFIKIAMKSIFLFNIK